MVNTPFIYSINNHGDRIRHPKDRVMGPFQTLRGVLTENEQQLKNHPISVQNPGC